MGLLWQKKAAIVTVERCLAVKLRRLAECQGRGASVLFEKAVEISGVFEAEAVGDVVYAPIGVVQERLGFAGEALGNVGRGGLTGYFLYFSSAIVKAMPFRARL